MFSLGTTLSGDKIQQMTLSNQELPKDPEGVKSPLLEEEESQKAGAASDVNILSLENYST